MRMIEIVCDHCGSPDVTKDATASWSVEKQAWVLSGVFDKPNWCEACEGETRLLEREVPAPSIGAAAAA